MQDREAVIPAAVKYWSDKGMADAVESGRVKLTGTTIEACPQLCPLIRLAAHDFFTPQPVKNPAVFYVRGVLLDWPDDHCVKILRQLRDAAAPKTQLIIQDVVTYYACEDPQGALGGFELGLHSLPPKPILPNWGEANAYPYYLDMVVR
jgi:hypothetical protein